MGDDGIATFYLYFDVIKGPQIVKSIGTVPFTEDDLISLKICSFPDTAVQSLTESIIFVFTIRKYYCYCIFSTISDQKANRGYRQFSYVIATTLPYFYPFTRILHSAMSIFYYMDENDILLLISDFVSKSLLNFPKEIGSDNEIPTLDGGLPVALAPSLTELLDFTADIGWSAQCKKYFLNSNFLGIDLINALSINQLIKNGTIGDIFRLWTSAVAGETIMIYGANPRVTSAAALGISSLLFPEPVPTNLYPYASVSDPRFKIITNNKIKPGTIIGFSNPIVLQSSLSFDLTFVTGFNNGDDGLRISRHSGCPSLSSSKPITNSRIRHFFYKNTLKVTETINTCLQHLREENPYAEFAAKINPNVMADILSEKGVQISSSFTYKEFASKLIHSPFFYNIWHRRCNSSSLLATLKHFSVDSLCEGRTEHELIDIRSMIQFAKDKCTENKCLKEIIDADLTTITLRLSPNAIIARAIMDSK